jgi:hypothetical protein
VTMAPRYHEHVEFSPNCLEKPLLATDMPLVISRRHLSDLLKWACDATMALISSRRLCRSAQRLITPASSRFKLSEQNEGRR